MKWMVAGTGFLLIYVVLVAYTGWNVYSWLHSFLEETNPWLFAGGWILWAFSFLIGRLGHQWLFFTVIGSYWLAFFEYSLLLFPLANIAGLFVSGEQGVFVIGFAVAVLFLIIFLVGSYLAFSPRVRRLSIHVVGPQQEALHVVMASDFHLGVLSGKKHLQRFVDKTNQLNPEVVLLAGDLVDDDPVWFGRYGMSEVMGQLKAGLGVYGVLGNHEYYGKKIPLLVRMMKESGVTILRDETLKIGDRFYLTGREDRTNGKRQSLESLKPENGLPWIVMDHTPSDLQTPVKLKTDFHVSGHTHKGQLWPNRLITRKVFELDYGYRVLGSTHFLVSSGFGFWGPAIRIGSRSELWSVKMTFGPSE